jgi:hypothetical protein
MKQIVSILLLAALLIIPLGCDDPSIASDHVTHNVLPTDNITYNVGDNGTMYKEGWFQYLHTDNASLGEIWITDNTSIHTVDNSTFGGGGTGPAGDNGTDGISILWLGTFADAPDSPDLNNAYRNSTDNVSYVWDGDSWAEIVHDGLPGAEGEKGNTGEAGPNEITTDTVTDFSSGVLFGSDGDSVVPVEVDDTPVDGATIDPISSNWAYDHNANVDAHHARYKIVDDDADTRVDVEESVDEDIIRMDVAGDEVFNLNAVGILTLAKQSGCYVSYASGQYLAASSASSYILFDTEVYDTQGEFDNTVKAGTARATTANHLIDNVANQFVAADVGRFVWNTTDNTYAIITVYNSPSDVTIDTNIMANLEGYKVYGSKFTPLATGTYLIGLAIQLNGNSVNGANIKAMIVNNGNMVAANLVYSPVTNGYPHVHVSVSTKLIAGDAITFVVQQSVASAKQLYPDASSAYAYIVKVN